MTVPVEPATEMFDLNVGFQKDILETFNDPNKTFFLYHFDIEQFRNV